MQRVVAHLTHRELLGCYMNWLENYTSVRRGLTTVRRTIAAMLQRSMAGMFHVWHRNMQGDVARVWVNRLDFVRKELKEVPSPCLPASERVCCVCTRSNGEKSARCTSE